jgi:hypothetical protein
MNVTDSKLSFHGMTKAKGCDHIAVGKFSRLFPNLPSLTITEDEAVAIGGPGGLMHDFDGASPDSAVPAGYIFFAQFVDHDVTLDATSKLRQSPPLEPEMVAKLPNIRSASLDLDAVYGFGPEGSPHIYLGERLGIHPNGHDLPRSPSGVALIGDPRNDENIFIAQLHLAFHRLHNRIYEERLRQEDIKDKDWQRFEAAQRETRYHYQWVVLFDFLKRICDPDIFAFAADKICDDKAEFPLCYGFDAHGKLPMPVEFSTAAYRVGHAMVRNSFAVNRQNQDVDLFDVRFRTTGFTELPEDLVLDWHYMLEIEPHIQPYMSKAIDPLLTDQLQNLPIVPSNNPNDRALAFRNLMRANAMGVPSGQAIAKEMASKGYPLKVCDLELDSLKAWKRVEAVLHKSEHDLTKNTPLFYYLLRESQLKSHGAHYGPLGSALLMEVFGGILRLCSDTIIRRPEWRPDPCIAKPGADFDKKRLVTDPGYFPLELADLVRFANGG